MKNVRLQTALESGEIDFIFPDNPAWDAFRYEREENIYSKPISEAVSATFVLTENRYILPSEVKVVSIPHGFSAITWHSTIKKHNIKTLITNTMERTLHSVQRGQSTAADFEYNAAIHILENNPVIKGLSLNKNLPSIQVDYHLSTVRHPELIESFSRYLTVEQGAMAELRNEYDIKSYEEVFGVSRKNASSKWLK